MHKSSEGALARHGAVITGQGDTTVLLAHGYGCDKTVWNGMLEKLQGAYRVVTFDHAGAGECDRFAYDGFRHGSLAGYAEDVIAVCEELRGGEGQAGEGQAGGLPAGRLVMVGHSVSAMIGALAAIKRPDLIDILVMIGPTASYINDGDYVGGFDRVDLEEFLDLIQSNFRGWGTAIAMLAMGNADRPELAEALRDKICRVDPAIAGVFARVTFMTDLRSELHRLTTPTVIMQCKDDPIAPESAIAFVHDAIAHSRLIRLDATGHCTHISHPDVVAAALEGVLRDDGFNAKA